MNDSSLFPGRSRFFAAATRAAWSLILGLLLLSFPRLSAQVNLVLLPANPAVTVNGTVLLTLQVQAGAQTVDGVEAHLDFDPAFLQVNTATYVGGAQLPVPLSALVFNNVSGTIDLAYGTFASPPSGTFDLATIEVEALSPGTSTISFAFTFPRLTQATFGGAGVLSNATGATISAQAANSIPVISPIGNTSVAENGSLQIPLSISDTDGDNLTVTISSISNEPAALQSNQGAGGGTQADPYPFNASGFLSQSGILSSPGSYAAQLVASPVFGDGGSNGDGSGIYTITVQVSDQDGNLVTEVFDLTVTDVHQAVAASGVTRIQAESYDNQGPANPGTGSNGIGVEINASGVTNIGFTTNGDFAEYLIDVAVAGIYQIDFAVAKSNGPVGTMTINGGPASISVNPTGGWQTYTIVTTSVSLAAGQQTLRLDWSGASGFFFNMDYFDISLTADNVPPVITLLGANPLTWTQGIAFVDPGATASDNVDGDLTASIVVGGSVNVNIPGTYSLTYDVTDAAGNAAIQVTRTVNVVAAVDNPPVITAVPDQELAAGATLSLAITVQDDFTPAATIALFDKSAGGTNPFNPSVQVNPANYTFTDNGGGNYQLTWVTTAADGRSYLARVTANDGVNPPVTEEFTVDIGQNIPGTILARTFNSPLPWYGSSTPQAPFTVAIESNAAQNIGYLDNGDFVTYLINVAAPGSYLLDISAAKGTAGTTTLTVSDENGSLGSVGIVNNGGGWQSYSTYSLPVVLGTAGLQTLRLDVNGGANLTQLVFSPNNANTAPTVQITQPATGSSFFVGLPISFAGTATDIEDGVLSANIQWESGIDGILGTGASLNLSTLSVGSHLITASVADLGSPALTGSASITIAVAQPAPVCNATFRVNAGGSLLADPSGDFTQDLSTAGASGTAQTGTPSPYYDNSAVDLTFATTTPIATNNTGYPSSLFQTERYSTAPAMDWNFPLSNGVYDVKLLFCEIWTGEAANPRVFDVIVEGNLFLDNYRPSGPAGTDYNVAKVETFQATVTDGVLNISFVKGTQNPAIKGFDICFVSALNTPPVATITAPVNGASVSRGSLLALTGTAQDNEDGNLDAAIGWSTDDPQTVFTPANATGAAVSAQLVRPGTTEIIATVLDTEGASGADTITVQVPGPQVAITFPAQGSTLPTTSMTLQWSATDVLFALTEHFHIWVNPADVNNLNPADRISTASQIGQLSWPLSATEGLAEGSNTVVIIVADQFHQEFTNPEARAVVTFFIADNTPPVISLLGANPLVLTAGTAYVEPGATASDNVDGDISANLVIDASGVNTSTVGQYQVTYNVSDAAGNPATQVVRTIEVQAAPSTDVFLIVTPANQTVNEGDPVSVMVQVEANQQPVDGVEIHLTFDPAVLQVQSLSAVGSAQLPITLVTAVFDNVAGTIDFAAGNFGPGFPSGTFDLLQINMTAVGGPASDLDFLFTVPATAVTFGGASVLTGTTKGIITVIENPELIISPGSFTEVVALNGTATNVFAVSTSNSTPLPGDLIVSSSEPWLAVLAGNNGYAIDATGLAPGVYNATLTATGTGYDPGLATVALTVQAPPQPGVTFAVTPGGALGASTFSGSSFQLTNTGNVNITGITVNLATGILPDMVWDPTGAGGDATASCLTINAGAAATGFVAPVNPCADPYSVPRQGGFDVISLAFTDFNAGELLTFTTDVDPNSIQGVPGAGNAGGVSGYELVGATVSVTFADGTVLTGKLFEDGSLGGGRVQLPQAGSTAPSIALAGYPGAEILVGDVNQIVTVTGTPGEVVTLLQMDSRLYIATGAPAFNVSDTTFYANEAMAGKAVLSATIGAGGTVDIPVTLFQGAGAAGTPLGGKNRFLAVTTPGPYATSAATSLTSNLLVVKYVPGFGEPAAIVKVNPGGALPASTFDNNSFQIQNTGTSDIVSVSIDLSTGFLMDVVFDPVGTAGDVGAKCLTPNTVVGTPGFVTPASLCTDPFSQPHNGIDNQEGYDVITLNFNDFNGGEQFNFSVDIDPTSIKNDLTTGDAGAISGAEIIGATVTITFADGTVISRCLFDDGSPGGAIAELTTTDLPAPAISMTGIGAGPAQTAILSQTIEVTGPANANVQLLQWDARLYIDTGSPAPYDIDPFEANETMTRVFYTGTLDATGFLAIPVTLLQTPTTNAGPDGGINHFMAVVADTGLTSCLSNVIVVEVIECGNDTTNLAATTCDPAQAGVTQVLLSNQFGCDSLVITTTTLLPADTTNLAATTCDPALAGVTQVLLSNQFGCDSLVITTTTLLPSDTTNLAATTCDPAQAGVSQVLLSNQFGCDSLVITTTTLISLVATPQNVACNDNGTPAFAGDDYLTFSLDPTGTNLSSTYTVSGSGITTTQGSYGVATVFTTQPGTAGNGDLQISISDDGAGNCGITATVSDPGACSVASVLTVDMGQGLASSGFPVCVAVTVQNYDSIGSGQGSIVWDPAVVSFQGVGGYGLPSIDTNSFSLLSPDVLLFSYSIPNPIANPNGEGLTNGDTLFTLCFVAIGPVGSSTTIELLGAPIPVEFTKFVTLPPVVVPYVVNTGLIEVVDLIRLEGAAVTMGGDTIPQTRFIQSLSPVDTTEASFYSFGIPVNQPAQVEASKVTDGDPDAGITTLDILLIKLHIFGTLPFATPYQRLAADVNLSGSITTLDNLLIQNIIFQNLFTYPQIGGTQGLWRMLPDDYVFPDPLNPWSAPKSRSYAVVPSPGLSGEDFLGLKLGDVNFSWNPPLSGLRESSFGELVMNAQAPAGGSGQTVRVPVTTEQFRNIAAFSYTLEWDARNLKLEAIHDGLLSPEYSLHLASQGQLPMLWVSDDGQGMNLPDGAVLFDLEMSVTGQESSDLTFTAGVAPAEAYNGLLQRYTLIGNGTRIGLHATTDLEAEAHGGYRLLQNVPNPFEEQTLIRFEVPVAGEVELAIYNELGQLVWQHKAMAGPGLQEVPWQRTTQAGAPVASGIYTLLLTAGGEQHTLRMSVQPD